VAKELGDGKENGCVVLFYGFVILDAEYALPKVSGRTKWGSLLLTAYMDSSIEFVLRWHFDMNL
jgi:hypothetical protein